MTHKTNDEESVAVAKFLVKMQQQLIRATNAHDLSGVYRRWIKTKEHEELENDHGEEERS